MADVRRFGIEQHTETRSDWTAADELKHPRGPGGKFRSNVDKLKHAIAVHRKTGQGDPFEGFDREQLRRVAKARGIDLGRGESHASIQKKLLADLDGDGPKAAPEKPVPKPRRPRAVKAVDKPEPTPEPVTKPQVIPEVKPKAPPRKRTPPKKGTPAPQVPETPKRVGTYTGPLYRYASPEAEREASELSDLKAKRILGDATDADIEREFDLGGDFDRVTRGRVDQEAYIKSNFERFQARRHPDRTAADLQAEMQRRSEETWAGKPIAVRVTPASLKKILAEGRFKTQFETGKSSALLDTKRRADVEARWFGIDPVNGDPKTRPIYGYVDVEGERPTADFGYLNQYGEVKVVLKDNVRDRTTAMWGDSLNQDQFGWPEPIDSPTWKSYAAIHSSGGATGILDQLDRSTTSPTWLEHNFVEAQIHGGVTSDDIAEVVLGKKPPAALQKALDDAGISWRVS